MYSNFLGGRESKGDAAGQGAREVVNLHVGPSGVIAWVHAAACERAASIMEIASVGMTFGE